jgi:5'-nucleotidase
VESRQDPTGRPYYWLGDLPKDEMEAGIEVHAVANDGISVTPIQLDLTDCPVLKQIAGWDLST